MKQLNLDLKSQERVNRLRIAGHRRDMEFHHREMKKWYARANNPVLPSAVRKKADYMATKHALARNLHEKALNLRLNKADQSLADKATTEANRKTMQLMDLL